jgi:hypothetical protein
LGDDKNVMVYTFLLSPDVNLRALVRKKKDEDDSLEPPEQKACTHTHRFFFFFSQYRKEI